MKIESNRLAVENYEQRFRTYSILDTYKTIWKILMLKPIRIWILLMVTHRFAFSSESVFRIKLVEKGVAREKLSFMLLFISPILTFLPLVLAKVIKKPKLLNYFRIFFFGKLTTIGFFCILIYNISVFEENTHNYSMLFYIVWFIWNLIDGFFSFSTSIVLGSFNARISDQIVGGTYLTFLALWNIIGANLARTSTLYIIGLLSFKKCYSDFENLNPQNETFSSSNLSTTILSNKQQSNQNCELLFDPFYPIAALSLAFGIAWLILSKRYFKYIQSLPKSEWKISR